MKVQNKVEVLALVGALAFSAAPARAGFWDWLTSVVCDLGCGLEWATGTVVCGANWVYEEYNCYAHNGVLYDIMYGSDCSDIAGDRLDTCQSWVNWDTGNCFSYC